VTAGTPLSIALSALDIAAMIATVGLLACRIAVLPGMADKALDRRLHAASGWALALLTLASFGILVSRTLEMGGGNWGALDSVVWPALTMTHFGHVWIWRVPALLVAWGAWAWGRHRPDRASMAWTMAFAVAVVVMTRSDTGHMADHGDLTLAVWVDWLHVLAAGSWIGSVFGMSLVVFPHLLRNGASSLRESAIIFQRLSALSGVALALVIACGIYSTTRLLGGWASLWTSPFGINLDIKLALVLVLILIGAHNRYVKLPRLAAGAGIALPTPAIARWMQPLGHCKTRREPLQILRSCARAVWAESLLGLAVIGATGLLIHQMPPADMPAMHEADTAQHGDAAAAAPMTMDVPDMPGMDMSQHDDAATAAPGTTGQPGDGQPAAHK
jgi:putative copper export protein